MKEATGEANMTVITIVLITIVAAVATPLIKNMLTGTSAKACCTSFGGTWTGGQCQGLVDMSGYNNCVQDSNNAANNN